ncbi:MAG: InlB B-repeat-containing protein, partial [Lachnospiraceae bacterium]|nr:InlB B-repeat-containing protein [Lachnospiraceae bacterium]
FTVTFKEENGDQIYEAVTVSANTLLTEVAVPKKAEYAFLGWYTTTGKFDIENTQVTSNLDLVAKWLYVGEVKEEDHPEAIDRLEKEEQDVIQITDKVWAAGVKKLKYTGKKVTQSIRVYDGTKLLTEKKDYTLTYKNNQNAYELGEDGKYSDKAPQVTIKMKGNYKGSKTINFQIEKQNISEAGFVSDDLYFDSKAGKTQKLNPVVTWNGKKLTKNDFTISKESVDLSKITEEPIKVTIEGKGNFEGTKTINVVVGTAKKDIALSKVKVAFKIDGKEVAKAKVAWNVWKEKGCAFDESVIVVTYNKKPLKINSDFKVRDYENNEKAGTATLILEGMGGSEENPEFKFHGQKRITFQINGTAMSSVKVNIPSANAGGYPYRGEAIKLLEETGVTVTSADGKTTLDSQDYSVTYTKNENKGTATATLTGNPAEGYTGTKKVTYKITAANIVKNDISFVSGSDLAPIMKGGAKPQVAVVVNGRTLKEGTDYTVAYAKNKKATTAKEATATIKGKGNYAGGAVLNFAVAAKSIDSEGVAIVAKDVVLKNDKWQQKSFKVYDADGKALKAGTDYTKEATYEKVVKAEDGSVTYEAIGSTLP